MTSKTLTLLGFATKAGKLAFGMNASVSAILSGKAKLVLTACDLSKKSCKEIAFHSQKKNIPVIHLEEFDIQTLSDAVGRKCGIISVNDSTFAQALTKALTTGGNANEQ